jgi:hypothetical protein
MAHDVVRECTGDVVSPVIAIEAGESGESDFWFEGRAEKARSAHRGSDWSKMNGVSNVAVFQHGR